MERSHEHRHKWASIHQTSSVRVLSRYKSNDNRYGLMSSIPHISDPSKYLFSDVIRTYYFGELHRSRDNYYGDQIYNSLLRNSSMTKENDGRLLPSDVMAVARKRYGIIKELSRFPVNIIGFDPVESKTLY